MPVRLRPVRVEVRSCRVVDMVPALVDVLEMLVVVEVLLMLAAGAVRVIVVVPRVPARLLRVVVIVCRVLVMP